MRSSWSSEQEERILKSSIEAVWPVDVRCEKMLDWGGFLHSLPVIGVIPMQVFRNSGV
jgi:hypothetical protein